VRAESRQFTNHRKYIGKIHNKKYIKNSKSLKIKSKRKGF
jgi:hypothetical protein